MIFDVEIPTAHPASRVRASAAKPMPRIEHDTPIVPHAVATGVWSEACVWLGEALPRRWIRELVVQANAIYARNPRFRRKIRRANSQGRDWLWLFTRHWLCALLLKHRPHLYARLPRSYSTGCELPESQSRPQTHLESEASQIRMRRRPPIR